MSGKQKINKLWRLAKLRKCSYYGFQDVAIIQKRNDWKINLGNRKLAIT